MKCVSSLLALCVLALGCSDSNEPESISQAVFRQHIAAEDAYRIKQEENWQAQGANNTKIFAGLRDHEGRLAKLESGSSGKGTTSGGSAAPSGGGVVTTNWPPGTNGMPTVNSGGVSSNTPQILYVTSGGFTGQPHQAPPAQQTVNGATVSTVTNPDILDRLQEHFGPRFDSLDQGQSKLLAGQRGLASQSEAIHNHLDYISKGVTRNGEALSKVQTSVTKLEERVSALEPTPTPPATTPAEPTDPVARRRVRSTQRQQDADVRNRGVHRLRGNVLAARQ